MSRSTLRFLLTDRCNFRCGYCHNEFQGDASLLAVQPWDYELVRGLLVEAAHAGSRRIKFSGGEPLLRPEELLSIARIGAEVGIEFLSIFTNLSRLSESLLDELQNIGLDRLNVNFPSFDSDLFLSRTGQTRYSVSSLLLRAQEARRRGLHIQLNMVLSDLEPISVSSYLRRELTAAEKVVDSWDAISLLVDDRQAHRAEDVQRRLGDVVQDVFGLAASTEGAARSLTFEFGERKILVSRCTDWSDPEDEDLADTYITRPGVRMIGREHGRAYRV